MFCWALPKSNIRAYCWLLLDMNQTAKDIPIGSKFMAGIERYCCALPVSTNAPLRVIDALVLVVAPLLRVALKVDPPDP